MKVTLINSFYSRSTPSGENENFKQLISGLRKLGVQISAITIETDEEVKSFLFRIRSALNIIFGKGSNNPIRKIVDLNPDIVHVNNLFPNFESYWLRNTSFPKVITVHNYRAICAAGTLSRDGKFCDLCVHKPTSSMRYSCYKDSRLATFPLYISRLFRIQERNLERFQRVYVPSKRALTIFTAAGIANDKWEVVPHAVDIPEVNFGKKTEKYVFVGRLTSEKGIERILDMWSNDFDIDVIGEGDLDKKRYASSEKIKFYGSIPREDVIKMLPSYRALVFCSSSPESALPLVVLESLASGLPIITTDHNTVADAVRDGNFGVVLPFNFSTLDLSLALNAIGSNYTSFTTNAKEYSKKFHNFENWIGKYISSYKQVVSEWQSEKIHEK